MESFFFWFSRIPPPSGQELTSHHVFLTRPPGQENLAAKLDINYSGLDSEPWTSIHHVLWFLTALLRGEILFSWKSQFHCSDPQIIPNPWNYPIQLIFFHRFSGSLVPLFLGCWKGFGCLQADTSQVDLWRWSAPEVNTLGTPNFDAKRGSISLDPKRSQVNVISTLHIRHLGHVRDVTDAIFC